MDFDDSTPLRFFPLSSTGFLNKLDRFRITSNLGGYGGGEREFILYNDAINWYAEDGTTAFTEQTLRSFLVANTGFSKAGDSSAITTTYFGFMDYNHNGSTLSLTADTWTDVPNNGLGAFTNKTYKPSLVSEVLDVSTGYLDFSELSLGSQIMVRNDFTVTPNTNNALLEARYLLGNGAGQYGLQFLSERLDSGSGIPYQRVTSFPIYMGDLNTQGNAGILQIKLSTAGTFSNAGSYIDIKIR